MTRKNVLPDDGELRLTAASGCQVPLARPARLFRAERSESPATRRSCNQMPLLLAGTVGTRVGRGAGAQGRRGAENLHSEKSEAHYISSQV